MTPRSRTWAVLSAVLAATACSDPTGPDADGPRPIQYAPQLSAVGDGEVNTQISVSPTLACSGTGTVTVTLTGVQPPPQQVAVEIALVIDESGSINSTEFIQMANAAQDFVGLQTLRFAEAGTEGVQVAVVKYSTTAALRLPLSSNRALINQHIQTRFFLGGSTFTDQGIAAARAELNGSRVRPGATRVLLLLTDGLSTQPTAALASANLAKAQGIRVFALGVAGADINELRALASSPGNAFFVTQFDQLEAAFAQIAEAIVLPAARNLTFSAQVGAGLTITGTPTASRGAAVVTGNGIRLSLANLGAETVTLEYEVTHDPAIAPEGGELLAVTNARLQLQVPQTGGAFSEEFEDQTTNVLCDTTPPEITADVGGTLGDNDWYVSDVTVSWTVDDPESTISAQDGCDAAGVLTDTDGVDFACSATSAGGTASETVTVKRDATAPTVTYSGGAGTYDILDDVAITCTAADNLSGVASHTCADISGPAYSFALGANTFAATATDNAGNEGGASVSFTVGASFESLSELVASIAPQGVANRLSSILDAAARSAARGNENAKAGQVGAFINQVNAQTGKALTAEQAALLIAIVGTL